MNARERLLTIEQIGSSVKSVKTDDFTSGKLLCFHRVPIGRG